MLLITGANDPRVDPWELFKMAVELAQAGALTPLNDSERKLVASIADGSDPIFEKRA